MQIKEQFLPVPSLRRSGEKLDPVQFIVAHDTGGIDGTAANNVNWYTKTAQTEESHAGVHFFVDDQEVIACIPEDEKAFSVRYNAGIAPNVAPHFMNDCAISIELCYFMDTSRTQKSYDNYTELMAELCKKYSLDPHTALVAHSHLDPSRRTDPENAFSTIGKDWEQFLVDVSNKLTALKNNMDNTETAKTILVKSISVTFDVVSNGETLQSGATVPVTVTPELCAALKLEDAGLIEGGYNVDVEAA